MRRLRLQPGEREIRKNGVPGGNQGPYLCNPWLEKWIGGVEAGRRAGTLVPGYDFDFDSDLDLEAVACGSGGLEAVARARYHLDEAVAGWGGIRFATPKRSGSPVSESSGCVPFQGTPALLFGYPCQAPCSGRMMNRSKEKIQAGLKIDQSSRSARDNKNAK
jgi:hypothetical protein